MKKDGLEIFTHTGVTECVEMPEGYIIETDRGHKIECKYVIIAAGFEAGKFLSREIMDLTSTYALVSHPVDSKDLWPEQCLIWETASHICIYGLQGEIVSLSVVKMKSSVIRSAVMRYSERKLLY